MNIIIFYHDDADGRCSAHLVARAERIKFYNGLEEPPEELEYTAPTLTFVPMNYGVNIFDTVTAPEDKVYILDFSVAPDQMDILRVANPRIVWIDHHKTSIAEYADYPHAIPGVRHDGIAACMLTYQYFANQDIFLSTPPPFVRWIADRDVMDLRYPESIPFFYGIQAMDTRPEMDDIWQLLWEKPDDLVDVGNIILPYVMQVDTEMARTQGQYVKFHGHKTFAVNRRSTLQVLEAAAPDAEVWMTYIRLPEFWTYSIYSRTVDVETLAKQHIYQGRPGGGHEFAAGFQTLGLLKEKLWS